MKHCALQVLPQHYGIVHDNLMEAIGETLGEAVTPDVAAGWSEAVNALGGILINHEAELYEAAAQRTGGWKGWRKFTIAERNEHNEDVSTFSLKASDGYEGGFAFTPGMYLTVDSGLKDSEGDIVAPRHYTITSAPGDKTLQITVKHLKDGKASSALHCMSDGMEVNCSPPFGDFLNLSAEKEALLLSAGIGVTPMYALHKHGGLNVKHAVHVDHTAGSNPYASYYVDMPGFEQIITAETGRPDVAAVVKSMSDAVGGLSDKHVYVCGPTGFMMEAVRALHEAGAGRVLFENFGPRTNENRE
jgi:nitric oxide dioxygenase